MNLEKRVEKLEQELAKASEIIGVLIDVVDGTQPKAVVGALRKKLAARMPSISNPQPLDATGIQPGGLGKISIPTSHL